MDGDLEAPVVEFAASSWYCYIIYHIYHIYIYICLIDITYIAAHVHILLHPDVLNWKNHQQPVLMFQIQISSFHGTIRVWLSYITLHRLTRLNKILAWQKLTCCHKRPNKKKPNSCQNLFRFCFQFPQYDHEVGTSCNLNNVGLDLGSLNMSIGSVHPGTPSANSSVCRILCNDNALHKQYQPVGYYFWYSFDWFIDGWIDWLLDWLIDWLSMPLARAATASRLLPWGAGNGGSRKRRGVACHAMWKQK